jgi:carboxylesterase
MYHHSQVNPIYKKGRGRAGALLIHGFTGSPDIMRPLANHLNDLGLTVFAPLLAGHGTTKENLAASTWRDWYGTVNKAFEELKAECSAICVAGLSLGGVLALKLAEDRPEDIRALTCLATPLVLDGWVRLALPAILNTPLKLFYRYQKKAGLDVKDASVKTNVWNIAEMPLASIASLTELQAEVKSALSRVATPTLLIHARADSTAPYANMQMIAAGISSTVTETVTLENSYHLVTVDFEKELVNRKVAEFFSRFV